MLDKFTSFFNSKDNSEDTMSLYDKKKTSLNVILYLVRMTHHGDLDWKQSDLDFYLYEANIGDWNVYIGRKATKNTITPRLEVDHFVTVKEEGSEEFGRLTEHSAIRDLVKTVERYLDLDEQMNTPLMEEFETFLDDQTDFSI